LSAAIRYMFIHNPSDIKILVALCNLPLGVHP
jgi:hypothetical protein